MIDLAAVTAALGAANAGLNLIDRIYPKVVRVLTGQPEPDSPAPYGQTIAREGDDLVSRHRHDPGYVQVITGEDLATKLSPAQLRLVRTFEQSMENHAAVFEGAYPQLSLETDAVRKAQIEQRLRQIIRDMSTDLTGILDFLRSCGFDLDDHYQHIRFLVEREARRGA